MKAQHGRAHSIVRQRGSRQIVKIGTGKGRRSQPLAGQILGVGDAASIVVVSHSLTEGSSVPASYAKISLITGRVNHVRRQGTGACCRLRRGAARLAATC